MSRSTHYLQTFLTIEREGSVGFPPFQVAGASVNNVVYEERVKPKCGKSAVFYIPSDFCPGPFSDVQHILELHYYNTW